MNILLAAVCLISIAFAWVFIGGFYVYFRYTLPARKSATILKTTLELYKNKGITPVGVLTPEERRILAITARSQASQYDDPRYNGLFNAAGGYPEGMTVEKWEADKPVRDKEKARWLTVAALFDTNPYREED